MPARAGSGVATAERTRDGGRSRDGILVAAEQLFSERGYDGTSLADIAAAAGLSRGAPSYFFGSKERLYLEVLDRAFAARQAATGAAFADVHAWCRGDAGLPELRTALRTAVGGYLDYLLGHPQFVALAMRDELTGGRRLAARTAPSTAARDAFTALRRCGRRRGVAAFDVAEAVLLFTSLTFGPASLRRTLLPAVGRDLARTSDRRKLVGLAVEQLMHLLTQ
jgi:AcrR family transcriptional regulator